MAMSDLLEYKDLLGIPFKYKGSTKEEGFDCWNLCREIYRRLGRELPEYHYFIEQINNDGKFQYENVDKMIKDGSKKWLIKIEKPESYCLVTFMIRPPFTSHIGIVLSDYYRFIHIMRKISVTVERLDSLEWKRRITGYWRYDGKA